MTTTTARAVAERLTAELKAVEHRLRGQALGPRDGVDDEIDLAVVGEQRELDARAREVLVGRRLLLLAAQERLRAGTYGTCLSCGDAIAEARLRYVPEVPRCGPCQGRLEREQAAEGRPFGVPRMARPTRPLEELEA